MSKRDKNVAKRRKARRAASFRKKRNEFAAELVRFGGSWLVAIAALAFGAFGFIELAGYDPATPSTTASMLIAPAIIVGMFGALVARLAYKQTDSFRFARADFRRARHRYQR